MTMTDAELCALIDRESRNSIGVDDAFQDDRIKAMQYYMGEAEGELAPPGEGRSKVVSKTLMDTVEWAMPCLMRMFSQDDTIRFEADTQDQEKATQDATSYCGHIFYRKNDGFTILHDAVKSCLITRIGVVKVYCEKVTTVKQERYTGLTLLEVEALQSDDSIEIAEVVQDGMLDPETLPEGTPPELAVTYTVIANVSRDKMEHRACGVPPDEIRISKDNRDIEGLGFISHERDYTRSELLGMGWDPDVVDALGQDETGSDSEKEERHEYDDSYDHDKGEGSERRFRVKEAYLRVDVDGDGISEYRKVIKSGMHVQVNEVTDTHPFAIFTPILMPYKIIGLSYFDLLEDLQRIQTALSRQMLDNAYLANNPRTAVSEGQVNLDDLLNPRVGGLVRVKGDVNAGMREMVTPFIGAQALEMLGYFGQVQDTRSGVTEMNSALNSEALAKGNIGSMGVSQLITAGQQRLELVARVLAETGIKRIWKLLLKNITQYTDHEVEMRINGRWLKMDPREWSNEYDMVVSVGVGSAGRAERLQAAQLIGMAQEKAFAAGIVKPENVYNLATDLVKAAGERQPERYFSPPDPNPQPPGPPEAVQVEMLRQQGQQQLAQVKAQSDIQVARMTQEFQAAQAQQETELEAQRDAIKMQNEMELERYKAELQAQLELQKAQIAQQTAIETARIGAQASVASAAMKPEPNGQD